MIKVPWDIFKLMCANYSLQMNAFEYANRIDIIGTKADGTALYYSVLKHYDADKISDFENNHKNNSNYSYIG